MRKGLSIAVLCSAIAFGAVVVEANECPLLIKQLRAAKIDDPAKAAQVKTLTDECEQLHQAGKHAGAVAKCDEAAKVGGIELHHKK